MASKISVEKLIKPFTGEGDVVAWLQKVELVAKLTGEKNLASFLPLYLEDGALAVYLEMPDEMKSDANLLQQELLRAFTDSQFVAFSKLKAVKWAGEPVDIYANEIRRLVRGCGFTGDGAEQLVKLTFITGFPDSISIELQQIQDVEKMKLGNIIPRARVLTSNIGVVGGVAAPALKGHKVVENQSSDMKERDPIKCYECGGPHLLRNCPEIQCKHCRGNHLLRYCPELRSNRESRDDKDQKGISGCAIGGMVQKGLIGCVVNRPQKHVQVPMDAETYNAYKTVGQARSKMPVISVVVNGREARALVDTGCTTTMVHNRFADVVSGEAVVSAFDGRQVRCKWASNVEITVAGKKMNQEVTVVSEMVKGFDMVLGMDVIAALGGVEVSGSKVQFLREEESVARGSSCPARSYDFAYGENPFRHHIGVRAVEPRERQKLKLLPRSRPLDASSEGPGDRSVFGFAKPVDTAMRDREIEEKHASRSLGASWSMRGWVH